MIYNKQSRSLRPFLGWFFIIFLPLFQLYILYLQQYIFSQAMLNYTSKCIKYKPFLSFGARRYAHISTQMIKKYQQQLQKANPNSLKKYPKTFQQKMMILNDPKTIKLLEVVEFGVKYKKGKNWLPLLLVSAALAGYLLQKFLPVRVSERYFMICPQSPSYISGYLFAGFNFGKPFYLYLPAMLGLYQLSRFINVSHLGLLIFANCVVGNVLSQYLVNKRVSQYEVWQNERLCFGQGNLISLIFSFWSYIGFTQAFTHLKSRIFLKAVPGAGVVRKGLPFGYICIFYAALELLFYQRGVRNSEVVLAQIVTGVLMGLVLRRIKPILK